MLEISVSTNDLENHFDVLPCFLHSASTLHAVACDGIKNQVATNEFWNEHFITAFFLFRHALELAVKALIKEIKDKNVIGHNIKNLWETNIPNHQEVLPEEIDKAFSVLEKYHVLTDAQLFHYHENQSRTKLKDMPLIGNDDFDALSGAVWAVRQKILEHIHVKNGFPLN